MSESYGQDNEKVNLSRKYNNDSSQAGSMTHNGVCLSKLFIVSLELIVMTLWRICRKGKNLCKHLHMIHQCFQVAFILKICCFLSSEYREYYKSTWEWKQSSYWRCFLHSCKIDTIFGLIIVGRLVAVYHISWTDRTINYKERSRNLPTSRIYYYIFSRLSQTDFYCRNNRGWKRNSRFYSDHSEKFQISSVSSWTRKSCAEMERDKVQETQKHIKCQVTCLHIVTLFCVLLCVFRCCIFDKLSQIKCFETACAISEFTLWTISCHRVNVMASWELTKITWESTTSKRRSYA